MTDSVNKICIIVGASHSGCQVAESVRKSGWQGRIILLGDEPHLPYHRPPLSKDFLLGDKEIGDILIRPQSIYEKNDIELKLSTRVETINRDEKAILLDDGESLGYDKLILAIGARARRISIEGDDKEGVCYLRTADDIEQIKKFVKAKGKAVIVGGGYIGLETAAVLRKLEMDVTIIEMMPRILQRVTAPDVSEFYHRIHTEEDVNIVTDAVVEKIQGDESVSQVICKDGQSFEADIVIIGVGVVPNVEIADKAGIEVNKNGIVVDEFCKSSDPNVFAIGDCTWHYNSIYDRWMRLESVPNAMDQARVAGAAVCGVLDKPYNQLPWFWSDQYDLKLQIAGLSQGFDDVVIRGDNKSGRKFAAFYFEADRLLAVDAVNMPIAFMFAKRIIANDTKVDKTKIADETVELKSLL